MTPRACASYRARTKGKVESGAKYAKRNGLAGRRFARFAELERHLTAWCSRVDARVHKTTHQRPAGRFEAMERVAFQPLPTSHLVTRERRLGRRVSSDSFVDVDTIRYSVPHRLVRDRVEVLVREECVRIFRGTTLVAEHRRSSEPHTTVVARSHLDGPWRRAATPPSTPETSHLQAFGRSLDDYAAVVGGTR